MALVGALALTGCGALAVTPWCPGFDPDCDPVDGGVDVPRLDVPDVPDVPDAPEVGVDAPRCEPGRTLCGDRCVSTTDDPQNCGGCGQQCTPVPGGRATCVMGVCGFGCMPGQHVCGTTCVPDDSPLTCGTACTPCTAPVNARATCTGGGCGWECNEGFVRVGERCELPAPRPIAPLSTATVTSQRPTLRFQLPAGADGATVEICRDRAFTVRCQTVTTLGGSARPTLALEPGVWFWRLWSRRDGGPGMNASPVWQFTVGARTAPVDTSHGTTLDVNGDGFADLAVSAAGAFGTGARVHVYLGSARGRSTPPALSLPALEPNTAGLEVVLANAGDVNGDGYGDLAVAYSWAAGARGQVHVYLGSAMGLSATPALSLTGPDSGDGRFGMSVAAAGDVNGDGYADLAVSAPRALFNTGRVHVYLGSATGLGSTPAFSLTGPDGTTSEFGSTLAGAGDFNADGYADLVVGAPRASELSGRVHVYTGSATGLSATPQLTLTGPDGRSGRFGWSLTSAGDLDGDGYADLVVAASRAIGTTGRIQVHLGSVRGLSSGPAASFTRSAAPGTHYAEWVTHLGDLNGDGFGEFAVGAPHVTGGSASVDVYFGRATGPNTAPGLGIGPLDVDNADFAVVRAAAGDYDGDGLADIVLSGTGVAGSTGRVYVYPGRVSGQVGTPVRLTGPDGRGGEFGGAIARAGSVRRAPRVGPMRGARLARVERGQR
jgi:hypothetical protein